MLLQAADTDSDPQAALKEARDIIESLQVAELDNFFKQACVEVTPIPVTKVDPKAALVYSIVLDNKIEVVLSHDRLLRHYTTILAEDELETTLNRFKKVLVEDPIRRRRFNTETLLPIAQKFYNWLLAEAESDLAQSNIDTITFVLDGPLRNIPVAALHDGQNYLIDRYNVALSPGLQLINPQQLPLGTLKVMAAGISQKLPDFPKLPKVTDELTAIKQLIPDTTELLDEKFTETALQSALNSNYYPIVHLATHGQFSSDAADTFILTWPSDNQTDYRINVNELQTLLQSPDLTGEQEIELLVLSACQTAEGDNRAALGLAGVAFRAGARSTLATLWPVSDEATAIFMEQFYKELIDPNITKGKALRHTQNYLRKYENEKF